MTDSALEEAFRIWGYQKARLNGVPPIKSIFGKFLASEGGPRAAASRGQPPPPLEVLLGTALEVENARKRAIEDGKLGYLANEALHARYVLKGPVKAKIGILGVSRRTFYRRLEIAKHVIAHYLGMAQNTG